MYPPRQVHLKISVREQHHGREQKFVSSFSHRYSISQKELSPTPHRGHWKFVTFNNLNPPLCTTKNHLVCGERGVPKVVQGANIRNHMKLLEIKIVRFEMGLFPTCRSVSANADASPHFTLSPPFLQISYCYSCLIVLQNLSQEKNLHFTWSLITLNFQSKCLQYHNLLLSMILHEIPSAHANHGRWWQFHINRFFSIKVFGEKSRKGFL